MANFPIPKDEAQVKVIMDAVREISASFTRQESERDFVNEALKTLSENTQIPGPMLREFATAYHKDAFAERLGKKSDFEELARALQPKAVAAALVKKGSGAEK